MASVVVVVGGGDGLHLMHQNNPEQTPVIYTVNWAAWLPHSS